MTRALPWLLAALSGLLMGLAYPPFDQGWLVWICLAPLLAALWFTPRWTARDWLRGALLGYACGLIFFWIAFFWITSVTVLGWFLLPLYLSLYPAVFGVFAVTAGAPSTKSDAAGRPAWLKSSHNLLLAISAAAAWTGLEWLRLVAFTGFGWNGLGVALRDNTPLIQIVDVTGVGGLSFLVVMVNAIVVATAVRLRGEIGRGSPRPHYDFTLTLGLVALVFSYGLHEMFRPPPESSALSLAAVQADIPQDHKWDAAFEREILDTYRRQSEIAIAMAPDLLIWPEAATPRPALNDRDNWDAVRSIAEQFSGDFLLGTVHYDETGDYNAALLLTDGGRDAQIYRKMHLVPFGEYVPFRRSFPLFEWVIGERVPNDFTPGPEPVLLRLQKTGIYLAPLICFEDTLGDLARRSALLGAQAFVTLTNDGWFRHSAGSRQHLANAVFRCAEMKLPMVRAANTGITCAIDRFGRVREILRGEGGDTFIEGVLRGRIEVPVSPKETFYARHGEVFSMACLALSIVVAGGSILLLRARKAQTA